MDSPPRSAHPVNPPFPPPLVRCFEDSVRSFLVLRNFVEDALRGRGLPPEFFRRLSRSSERVLDLYQFALGSLRARVDFRYEDEFGVMSVFVEIRHALDAYHGTFSTGVTLLAARDRASAERSWLRLRRALDVCQWSLEEEVEERFPVDWSP